MALVCAPRAPAVLGDASVNVDRARALGKEGEVKQCIAVYGGQYGSEGKASAAEFWAKKLKLNDILVVIGENSPNSGHTCSLGATRNIPAASFWADEVILGPDSVIEPDVLIRDIKWAGGPRVYIHENAALMRDSFKEAERSLVSRISSTGSGSGAARGSKFIDREPASTVAGFEFPSGITVLKNDDYIDHVSNLRCSVIFEGSQGVLLDTNFGRFPYVTSRSTLPRVAIERNGLGHLPWVFCGVYRSFPIRTGGPSGPTGGRELDWDSVGVPPEIATVTKRNRRVFEFSCDDFRRSVTLSRPDVLMFTFMDYIERGGEPSDTLRRWMREVGILDYAARFPVWASGSVGEFHLLQNEIA